MSGEARHLNRSLDELAKDSCRVEVIAQCFGLTVRRIQQLTQEGILPTVEDVEDGRTVRRYELVPTIQRYVEYLAKKAYGKTGKTNKEIELREQKLEADIALKESQGELHRLKTAIAAGDYISLEEVKMDYSKFFITFKKFAMSLPSRVTGMVSGQLEPVEARKMEKEIAEEINHLLNAFVIAGTVNQEDAKEYKKAIRNAKKENPDPEV